MKYFALASFKLGFKILLALLITIITLYLIILIADNGTPQFNRGNFSTEQAINVISSNITESTGKQPSSLNQDWNEQSLSKTEIAFAPSLIGTDIPAAFVMDNEGNLVINRDVRYIFDYFLTSQGEISQEVIWAQIEQLINQQLSGNAKAQAKKLFNNYLSYQDALHNLNLAFPLNTGNHGAMDMSNPETLTQLEARFQAKQSLREEYFGIENKEVFFNEEEDYDRYHLDKLSINFNSHLSKEEKQYQLSQLQQQLPENLLDNRHQVNAIQTLKAQLGEFAEKGSSYQERMTFITEMAGEEAANRFSVSQLQADEWHAKRKVFLQQREDIVLNPALAKEEKEAAINYLLTSMEFTDGDILRLNALDRIEG